MSWISNFFNPDRAYEGAGKKEQAGYEEGKGLRQPYMEHGVEAGNQLQELMQQLMHPEELQNKWAEGYTTSPAAQGLQRESMNQGLNAASSMGLGGSSAALGNIQQTGTDIMNKDRQQYMNDLMQKFMGSVGLGENVYGVGANTANAGAQGAQSHGEWQGQNEFNKENAGTSMFKQFLPMIAAMMMGKNPAGGEGGGGGLSLPSLPSTNMFGGG